MYVFPFINLLTKHRTVELLKVSSLGVIGALLKGDDSSEAVKHLVKTELIVLCLRIMKKGSDVARTTATFIVMKILLDNSGLEYICRTEDRMQAVAQILRDLMDEIDANKSSDAKEQKMVSQVLRSFLRLSENPR
jgi:CCR4-NOT transcription complex subunit 9